MKVVLIGLSVVFAGLVAAPVGASAEPEFTYGESVVLEFATTDGCTLLRASVAVRADAAQVSAPVIFNEIDTCAGNTIISASSGTLALYDYSIRADAGEAFIRGSGTAYEWPSGEPVAVEVDASFVATTSVKPDAFGWQYNSLFSLVREGVGSGVVTADGVDYAPGGTFYATANRWRTTTVQFTSP